MNDTHHDSQECEIGLTYEKLFNFTTLKNIEKGNIQ